MALEGSVEPGTKAEALDLIWALWYRQDLDSGGGGPVLHQQGKSTAF